MRKLRNVSGAIALFLIALVIGIYVGGRLSYAAEEAEELQYYPNFGSKLHDAFTEFSYESAGWRIETKEMLYQVQMSLIKGEMEMYFVLTDDKRDVLETSKYHLYIRGYDPKGDASWCQDIPPIIKWP